MLHVTISMAIVMLKQHMSGANLQLFDVWSYKISPSDSKKSWPCVSALPRAHQTSPFGFILHTILRRLTFWTPCVLGSSRTAQR